MSLAEISEFFVFIRISQLISHHKSHFIVSSEKNKLAENTLTKFQKIIREVKPIVFVNDFIDFLIVYEGLLKIKLYLRYLQFSLHLDLL